MMNFLKQAVLCTLLLPLASLVLAWQPVYWQVPGVGPYNAVAPWSNVAVRKGIHLVKSTDEMGYTLRVHLVGIEPQAIEMQLMPGYLLLRSAEARSQQQRNDYAARTLAYSFSLRRRIALPADADVSAIHRRDSANLIEIRLPRR